VNQLRLTLGVRFSWWLKPALYLACVAAFFGFGGIDMSRLMEKGIHVYAV
jgi:hypothetical protein